MSLLSCLFTSVCLSFYPPYSFRRTWQRSMKDKRLCLYVSVFIFLSLSEEVANYLTTLPEEVLIYLSILTEEVCLSIYLSIYIYIYSRRTCWRSWRVAAVSAATCPSLITPPPSSSTSAAWSPPCATAPPAGGSPPRRSGAEARWRRGRWRTICPGLTRL